MSVTVHVNEDRTSPRVSPESSPSASMLPFAEGLGDGGGGAGNPYHLSVITDAGETAITTVRVTSPGPLRVASASPNAGVGLSSAGVKSDAEPAAFDPWILAFDYATATELAVYSGVSRRWASLSRAASLWRSGSANAAGGGDKRDDAQKLVLRAQRDARMRVHLERARRRRVLAYHTWLHEALPGTMFTAALVYLVLRLDGVGAPMSWAGILLMLMIPLLLLTARGYLTVKPMLSGPPPHDTDHEWLRMRTGVRMPAVGLFPFFLTLFGFAASPRQLVPFVRHMMRLATGLAALTFIGLMHVYMALPSVFLPLCAAIWFGVLAYEATTAFGTGNTRGRGFLLNGPRLPGLMYVIYCASMLMLTFMLLLTVRLLGKLGDDGASFALIYLPVWLCCALLANTYHFMLGYELGVRGYLRQLCARGASCLWGCLWPTLVSLVATAPLTLSHVLLGLQLSGVVDVGWRGAAAPLILIPATITAVSAVMALPWLCFVCDIIVSTVWEIVMEQMEGACCSNEQKREAWRNAHEDSKDQHRRDVLHSAEDHRAELAARADDERKRGEANTHEYLNAAMTPTASSGDGGGDLAMTPTAGSLSIAGQSRDIRVGLLAHAPSDCPSPLPHSPFPMSPYHPQPSASP